MIGRVLVRTRGDDVAIVRLVGEHDLSTQPAVLGTLDAALAAGAHVIVDLSMAEFIDSAITNALAIAHQRAQPLPNQRVVSVVPPGPHFVTRTLELVGIDRLVPIYPTEDAALAALAYAEAGDLSRN
jgi:anti-anti-sigma factor